MLLVLALCNIFGYGWGFLTWIGVFNHQRWTGISLRITLAALLGLGFTSMTFFGWVGFFQADLGWYWLFETSFGCLLLICGTIVQRRRPKITPDHVPQPQSYPFIAKLAIGIIGLALGMIGYTMYINPHGAFDAWAIWNAHARFIFARDLQSMYQPYATPHADYPYFIPASIARLWSAIGNDASIIAAVVAMIMVGSIITLIYNGLTVLTNRTQALIGLAIIFATSHFIYASSSLMADVPLSAFFVATLVCLALSIQIPENRSPWLLCAGLCAGLAAWTKNEGLLFCVVVLVVWLIYAWKNGRWSGIQHHWGIVFIGIAPIVGFNLLIKHLFKLQSDLSSELSMAGLIENLTNPSRHLIILRFYGAKIFTFGRGIIPITGLFAGLIGLQWYKQRAIQWISFAIPLALLAGYWAIYLNTPHDLTWHLTSSLDRLIVQVWPLIVFGICLSIRTLEKSKE